MAEIDLYFFFFNSQCEYLYRMWRPEQLMKLALFRVNELNNKEKRKRSQNAVLTLSAFDTQQTKNRRQKNTSFCRLFCYCNAPHVMSWNNSLNLGQLNETVNEIFFFILIFCQRIENSEKH